MSGIGTIRAHGATDLGGLRMLNQDRFSLADISGLRICFEQYQGNINEKGFLLLVSDGAGGEGRGEVASALAVHVFQEELFQSDPARGVAPQLNEAARIANEIIWEQSHRVPECEGMSATLTAAWIVPPHVYVVAAGDSRCYLVRGTSIKPLTRRSDITSTSDTDATTQGLGTFSNITPIVTGVELARGDKLLLCTASLCKRLTDTQILEVLVGCNAPASACRLLIESAKELRIDDNVTVVVAEIDGEAFSPREQMAGMLISEALEQESQASDLEDLTDLISPAEPISEEG